MSQVLKDERVSIAKAQIIPVIEQIVVQHHQADPSFDLRDQRPVFLWGGEVDEIDLLGKGKAAGERVKGGEVGQKRGPALGGFAGIEQDAGAIGRDDHAPTDDVHGQERALLGEEFDRDPEGVPPMRARARAGRSRG